MKFPVSASNVASSKPYIGLLLRKDTKDMLLSLYHFFFLLLACMEELLLTPNFIIFLPNPLPQDNLKVSCVSKVNAIASLRILIRITIFSQLKDTIKAYFCYHYTLLYTTTLSMLFYLFWNYTCVILMDAL